jgi:hypothetical protein
MQLILFFILSACAVAKATQNITANIFLPTAFEPTIQFVASVFGECDGKTTYGVRCTAGVPAPSFTCGSDTPVCTLKELKNACQLTFIQEFTVTEASNQYIATRTTPISSAVVTITETCSLQGTTYASCTADIVITGSGKVTSRSTSSTLTGTNIPTFYMYVPFLPVSPSRPKLTTIRYNVPVTGGGQILQATGNVCVVSGATRTTTPFIFGAMLGLFVFTAAVVL